MLQNLNKDNKISQYTKFSILTYIITNIVLLIINYPTYACYKSIKLLHLNFAMLLIAKMFILDPLKEIDYSERLKKIFLNKNTIFGLLYIVILCRLTYSLEVITLFTGLLIILYAISYFEKKRPNLSKKKLTSKFSIFSVILYSLACLIIFNHIIQKEYSRIIYYKQLFPGFPPQEINQNEVILNICIAYIPTLIIYISTILLLGEPLIIHKKSEKKIMSQKTYLICFIILILISLFFPLPSVYSNFC